ncbi:MAG: hypothetical protein LBR91_03115 [Puniceicoccales bacterium]|nr:hypothetical protein [Puniceicoccales bacterium]
MLMRFRFYLMLVVVMLFVENSAEHCYADESYKNVSDLSQTHESSQGTKVDQSFEKAFKRFSKAAEQGDASAQNELGQMYYSHSTPQRHPIYSHLTRKKRILYYKKTEILPLNIIRQNAFLR